MSQRSRQSPPADWLSKFPKAWSETGGTGMAKQVPPVMIDLKAGAAPIRVRQYPMSKEAREGIRPHIQRLLAQGILVSCKSPWNTPLLPVKKPGTSDYRPVQDLQEVNQRVQDIHPTVPNPYTLLSSIPSVYHTDLVYSVGFKRCFLLPKTPSLQPAHLHL